MWDESELDDMERLALAARRDPGKWGARYVRAQREEREWEERNGRPA